MNEKQYDAIIVGAGVGGLSVGTLLAKEGLKVLMLEQCDRPGGRALSVRGEEISEKGLEWYRDLLAKQFSYIADSQPNVATIVDWKLDLVCWKLEGVAKSISQAGTQKVPA